MRVHLIPDEGQTSGGGGQSPPAAPDALQTFLAALAAGTSGQAPPVPVPTVTKPGEPVIPAGMRLVPEEQFNQILARLDGLTQSQAEREAAQRQAEANRLARTAEADPAKAYKELQTQYQADQQRWTTELETERTTNAKTHRGLSISQALAARTDLVDGAAAHLSNLLAADPQLEVVRENGQVQVRTRTLQSVPAYLADLLKRPENRLFLKASSAGGSGATQTQATGGGQWGNDSGGESPANLGLAIVGQFKQQAARTDGQFDPGANRFARRTRG